MPDELLHDPGILAYARLSQEDADRHTTSIADRMALRSEYLRQVARFHGLALTDEQIVCEVETGASLSERTGLLDILARCSSRDVHTLVIFDVDRLTRDLGDWKRIERALFAGEIRLITARGAFHFTRNFDPMPLQILAMFGEGERRRFSFRAKAANDQRARKGQLSGGRAVYGYQWDKARRVYEVLPDEYTIVVEIFARLFREGGMKIAADLNRRGVPPPALGERVNARATWRPGSLIQMARNPFYAGFPAKRKERDREGRAVNLPTHQWVWAEEEQPYPHPLTLDEWERLQEIITRRRNSLSGRTGLLTGLLTCAEGHRMALNRYVYCCSVVAEGKSHKGSQLRATVLERTVLRAVDAALANLGAGLRQTAPKRPQVNAQATLAETARAIRSKTAAMTKLQQDAAFLDSLRTYGRERRLREMQQLDGEIAELQDREEALRGDIERQGVAIPPALKDAALSGGLERLREENPAVVREILRLVVKSIQPVAVPEGRRNTPELLIALRPPFGDLIPHTYPMLYARYKPRQKE